jgi:hypothetical protein
MELIITLPILHSQLLLPVVGSTTPLALGGEKDFPLVLFLS